MRSTRSVVAPEQQPSPQRGKDEVDAAKAQVDDQAPSQSSHATVQDNLTPAVDMPVPDPGKADEHASSSELPLSRRVFNLAWPVISENFLQTMLGIIDTLMVARLGPAALAGVGAALQVMFFIISTLSATSIGSAVLVAQAVGAKNYDRASQFAKQSLVWSVLISIPLVIVGLWAAEPIMGIFGMEPDVTAIGADYLRVTMGTVVVLTLSLLGGGVLRGAGDSRTPMLITLAANVLNVFISYGLIFGQLGMPEIGVIGSAWGTFLARLFGFVVLFYVMWRGINGVSIRGREGWWPNVDLARQLLKIGVPAALEQMINSVGFLTMSVVVAQLGTLALAAHRIALNAMSVSFLPGFGFAMAATALVGQSIGANRRNEGLEVGRIATKWASVWMGTLGIVFLFFADGIIALFTPDPTVINLGGASLRAIAFTQIFWAISFVQSGALRGTGDTQYPLRVGTTGIWAAVIIGWLAVTFFNGGLTAVWGAFLITAPVTAYLFQRKFRNVITQEETKSLV